MAKNEPNVKDQTRSTKMSDSLSKFLTDLRAQIQNDSDNRSSWLRKITVSYNQRTGVKRITNRPYPGAPNLPLPEADKIIIKKKPNFILSAFQQRKKAFVRIAEGVRETDELRIKRKRAELGINFVLNNKIKLFHILDLASDNFLEKGHAIFKVFENFKSRQVTRVIELDNFPETTLKQLRSATNAQLKQFIADRENLDIEDEDDKKVIDDVVEQFRSRKQTIEFKVNKIESWPDIVVRPPERITPPTYAKEIDDVERLTDETFMTKRELTQRANQGIYDKKIVDELDKLQQTGSPKSSDEADVLQDNKEIVEGVVEEGDSELFRIQDVLTWWKPDDKKEFERWVFTFVADMNSMENSLLRMIPFPFEFETWNYVKHDNEVKDDRWYASRGDPERIRFLQDFMERSANNMLIRDDINNAPIYTVMSTSKLQSNSVRFIPGQKLKVSNHDEIKRLDDRMIVDQSSQSILTTFKAFAEEYLSSTDQLFRNATNKGGGKTLGEVKLGVAEASAPTNVDVLRWFITLQKLYTMVFELMRERLGDSIFIEGEEITAEDFNFEATIVPNGSIDLIDAGLKTAKASNRLQIILNMPPEFVTTEDKFNAYRDWLEADGVQDPDRYATDPKLIAEANQQNMLEEDQILAQQEEQINEEIAAQPVGAAEGG